MTAPLRPAPASLYGKSNWVLVNTIASGALIPTAAEVNAGTSLDITSMVFADSARPTQSTNRVTQERRLGDTVLSEFIGSTTYTGGEMHYAFDAQGAVASNGKKLFEKIPAGTSCYLVERLGVANATTPATGQFVNTYPVTFGPSFPSQAGDAETAEAGMVATFAVTATPAISVALT
jgi:hypothetical protein